MPKIPLTHGRFSLEEENIVSLPTWATPWHPLLSPPPTLSNPANYFTCFLVKTLWKKPTTQPVHFHPALCSLNFSRQLTFSFARTHNKGKPWVSIQAFPTPTHFTLDSDHLTKILLLLARWGSVHLKQIKGTFLCQPDHTGLSPTALN